MALRVVVRGRVVLRPAAVLGLAVLLLESPVHLRLQVVLLPLVVGLGPAVHPRALPLLPLLLLLPVGPRLHRR